MSDFARELGRDQPDRFGGLACGAAPRWDFQWVFRPGEGLPPGMASSVPGGMWTDPGLSYWPSHAINDRGLYANSQMAQASGLNVEGNGAVAGDPGTLPTGWLFGSSGGGASVQVLSVTPDPSGYGNRVGVRITNNQAGVLPQASLIFAPANLIAMTSAQKRWIYAFVRLLPGSTVSSGTVHLGVQHFDGSQSYLNTDMVGPDISGDLSETDPRLPYSVNATASDAATATVQHFVRWVDSAGGESLDLEVWCPGVGEIDKSRPLPIPENDAVVGARTYSYPIVSVGPCTLEIVSDHDGRGNTGNTCRFVASTGDLAGDEDSLQIAIQLSNSLSYASCRTNGGTIRYANGTTVVDGSATRTLTAEMEPSGDLTFSVDGTEEGRRNQPDGWPPIMGLELFHRVSVTTNSLNGPIRAVRFKRNYTEADLTSVMPGDSATNVEDSNWTLETGATREAPWRVADESSTAVCGISQTISGLTVGLYYVELEISNPPGSQSMTYSGWTITPNSGSFLRVVARPLDGSVGSGTQGMVRVHDPDIPFGRMRFGGVLDNRDGSVTSVNVFVRPAWDSQGDSTNDPTRTRAIYQHHLKILKAPDTWS